MADFHISDPTALARLPRTATSDGRSWFSIVYGLANKAKKRRVEICAAVDGNSVNTYEIQNGRIIASYVVPPDSIFTCPPLSLRVKDVGGHVQRRTYCVMKRQNQQFIQLFTHDGDRGHHLPVNASFSLEQVLSPVVQISILCEVNAIAILLKNGSIQLFSPDLSSMIAQDNLSSTHDRTESVMFACLSATSATKSILRSRPDITCSMQADSSVICVVSRFQSDAKDQADSLCLTVWSCTSTTARSAVLSQLVSHSLPFGSRLLGREHDSVHFSSGNRMLIVRSGTRYVQYDMTKPLPELVSDLSLGPSDNTSNIEITDGLLLCSKPNSLQLYNSKFRSVQATNEVQRSGLKRKREDPTNRNVSFIAYFHGLHRAVATRKNNLVAVDLRFLQNEDASIALKRSASLLNNIGKGVSQPSRMKYVVDRSSNNRSGSLPTAASVSDDWTAVQKKLDEAYTSSDFTAFESTFLSYVNSKQKRDPNTSLLLFDFQTDYLLSKLFSSVIVPQPLSEDGILQLTLNFGSVSLHEWLFSHGCLCPRKILEALALQSSTDYNDDEVMVSIINALRARSPSLVLLAKYLDVSPILSPRELCLISKLLLSWVTEQTDDTTLSMTDILEQSEQPVETNLPLTPAVERLHTISPQMTDCLVLVLARLAETDSNHISVMLKSTCKQHDLLALIQFLRQQLFHSGYTRSVLYQGSYDSETLKQNPSKSPGTLQKNVAGLSIYDVATLLSSCMDALGALSLINIGTEAQFLQTIIAELLSETTRAVEAAEDAAYLRAILRETLRFLGSEPDIHRTSMELDKTTALDHLTLHDPGSIRVIYSESANDHVGGAGSALPISLRHEDKLATTKVRKGDGQAIRRSGRELGMLKDRLRGPYSFERLVL